MLVYSVEYSQKRLSNVEEVRCNVEEVRCNVEEVRCKVEEVRVLR